MLEAIILQTNLYEFLTRIEQVRLREINTTIRESLFFLSIRHCTKEKAWTIVDIGDNANTIYWDDNMPSIAPRSFWPQLFYWCRHLIDLRFMEQWTGFYPRPIMFHSKECHQIGIDIQGTFNDWISIGIFWNRDVMQQQYIGMDEYSIGYHTDDNAIYHDSFPIQNNVVDQEEELNKITCIIDYMEGTLCFYYNDFLGYTMKLNGDILVCPFYLGVSAPAKTDISYSLVARNIYGYTRY